MIVDDEQAICEEFRETFEHEGHQVDVALDGKEGLQKVQRNQYHLVFLDECMPWMAGDKVFQKIRQVSKVPVAFISGFLTPEKQKKVISMGALTCLHKPLDLDRVKSLIHTVASRSHHQ